MWNNWTFPESCNHPECLSKFSLLSIFLSIPGLWMYVFSLSLQSISFWWYIHNTFLWVNIGFFFCHDCWFLTCQGFYGFLLGELGWMKPGRAVWTFGAILKCFLTRFKYPHRFQRGKAKTFEPELELNRFFISRTAVHAYVGLFQELISKTAKWSSITLPQTGWMQDLANRKPLQQHLWRASLFINQPWNHLFVFFIYSQLQQL